MLPLILADSIFLQIPLNSNNTSVIWLTLFLLIVFSEAVVMNAMDWGGSGLSLLDSLLMNIASAAVGYVSLTIWPSIFLPLQEVLLLHTQTELVPLLFLFTTLVLVECGVLWLLRRHSVSSVWLVSSFANLVSCILLAFGTPFLINK